MNAESPSFAVPHGGPPPDPPELPERYDPPPRWPAWFAPVGFLGGFAATILVSIVVGVIVAIAGVDVDDDTPPALVVVLTLIQDAILCGTAIFLASRVRRPRAWHFGLRRARFWPTVGWAALALGSFLSFVIVYSALVSPDGDQSVTEDLGADQGTLALVLAGIVVIVVAPLAEEFFFRGFFYRALRSRMGVTTAAAVDGVVFGLIHFTGSNTLELLPILGCLGFVFCLVYERTGTLYATIALHSLNNSFAYGASTDNAAVPLVLGILMLSTCALGPRILHPRTTAAYAP